MNTLLNFVNLLGASYTFNTGQEWLDSMLTTIRDIIETIVVPVIVIVATVGLIYAIVLGVNYAKAETTDQKEEAKKRIINVVVGALLMIVLMLLLYLFIANADKIFGFAQNPNGTQGTQGTGSRLFF